MKPRLAPLALLPLLAAPSAAGGLDASRVPAEARALVHLDLEGLQRTGLWRAVREPMLEEASRGLDEIEREFGLRPLEDVRSITVWDTSGAGEAKAAALVTSARIDAALERLQQEPQYHAIESDDLRVHVWQDGDEAVYAFVHPSGPDERIVLLSDGSEHLMQAVRVLYGQAPSLARASAPAIAASPAPGSFLFVAVAQGLSGAEWGEEASAVLGLAERIALDVGEVGQDLFAHASIWTGSLEDAQNLNDILEGVRALGRLVLGHAEDAPPEALMWLDAVRFGHVDDVVQLDLRIPVLELIEAARSAEQR